MHLHDSIPGGPDPGWTLMSVRGVAALMFGLVALFFPSLGLPGLLLVFATYLAIDAVFVATLAWRAARDRRRMWHYALEAAADFIVAAAILVAPETVVPWFVYLVAIWAVSTGLFAASPLLLPDDGTPSPAFLEFYAVVSVVWGCALIVVPLSGAVLVARWLAAYAILVGVVLVAQGLRHRRDTMRVGAG